MKLTNQLHLFSVRMHKISPKAKATILLWKKVIKPSCGMTRTRFYPSCSSISNSGKADTT